MGRTSKETDAKAAMEKDVGVAALAFGGSKVVESVKAAAEAVEPILYVAIFGWFFWIARQKPLRSADLNHAGAPIADGYAGWYADASGFAIGPIVSTFIPRFLIDAGKRLTSRGGFPVPGTPTFTAVDQMKAARVRMREIDGTYFDPFFERTGPATWELRGYQLRWPHAVMIGAVSTLLAKGAGGIVKALIP